MTPYQKRITLWLLLLAFCVGMLWYQALTQKPRIVIVPASTPTESAPEPRPSKTPQQVFREANYAVEIISVWDKAPTLHESMGLGSGFLIHFNGKIMILTARHVVHRDDKKGILKEIFVGFREHFSCSATIDKMYPELDLAVLIISEPELPFADPFATPHLEADYEAGDRVFSLGSPLAMSHCLGVGHIVNASWTHSFSNRSFIVHDAPVAPGSSGGPLVDEKGRVIGMNVQMDGEHYQFGYAIKMTDILAWLAQNY